MLYIIRSIKADFYRLFKSKGFWISILLMVGFVFMSIQDEALGNVGVTEAPYDEISSSLQAITWSADNAIKLMLTQMFMLLYFSIPSVVVILGHDFKNKTYKNIITTGITRTEYFISKSLTILLSAFMLVIIFYATTFVIAGSLNGFGDSLSYQFHLTQFKHVLLKFFFIAVNLMLGVAILYLTRSNVSMILAITLAPLLIQIITIIIFPNVSFLKYLDIQTALSIAGTESLEITKYFIGALSMYLGISTLSLVVFENTEL